MIRTQPRAEPIRCGNLARASAVLDNVEAMRRLLLAAGAVAILVAISGCDAADPRVTPAPTPSATPVFASDEEALAAAEAAYAAYLAVSDAIVQEGGAKPERIAPHVTEEQLPATLDGFKAFVDGGLRSTGASAFDGMTIAQFDETTIDAYVCLDITNVRIIDATGTDVTRADRDNRLPLELGFEVSPTGLLIARSDAWSGNDFC